MKASVTSIAVAALAAAGLMALPDVALAGRADGTYPTDEPEACPEWRSHQLYGSTAVYDSCEGCRFFDVLEEAAATGAPVIPQDVYIGGLSDLCLLEQPTGSTYDSTFLNGVSQELSDDHGAATTSGGNVERYDVTFLPDGNMIQLHSYWQMSYWTPDPAGDGNYIYDHLQSYSDFGELATGLTRRGAEVFTVNVFGNNPGLYQVLYDFSAPAGSQVPFPLKRPLPFNMIGVTYRPDDGLFYGVTWSSPIQIWQFSADDSNAPVLFASLPLPASHSIAWVPTLNKFFIGIENNQVADVAPDGSLVGIYGIRPKGSGFVLAIEQKPDQP